MNNIIPIVKPDNYINAHDKSAKHYDVFLDENLGEPADYRDLLSVLFNACENDTIHLFINCNGGHLDTTVAIVEGLKYTAADTTAIILGACHSGASMIALFCHNVAVTDNSYMMIHTASFGSSGNTTNVKAHTDFTYKQVDKLLDATYEGFLTKEELASVKKGVELWFDAEEISKRVEKRLKHLKKQLKRNKENTNCIMADTTS